MQRSKSLRGARQTQVTSHGSRKRSVAISQTSNSTSALSSLASPLASSSSSTRVHGGVQSFSRPSVVGRAPSSNSSPAAVATRRSFASSSTISSTPSFSTARSTSTVTVTTASRHVHTQPQTRVMRHPQASSNAVHSQSIMSPPSPPVHTQQAFFFRRALALVTRSNKRPYEPQNSYNPSTLRTSVYPSQFRFSPHVLPAIDIVSVSAKQYVSPYHPDECFIVDKTPKILEYPNIVSITKNAKFVTTSLEATIAVTDSIKFSLLDDNFLEIFQTICETATSNIINLSSLKDVLDPQYEPFYVTSIHEELQKLFEDVGVDVLKVVMHSSPLDLSNVDAQLQLLKQMNDISAKAFSRLDDDEYEEDTTSENGNRSSQEEDEAVSISRQIDAENAAKLVLKVNKHAENVAEQHTEEDTASQSPEASSTIKDAASVDTTSTAQKADDAAVATDGKDGKKTATSSSTSGNVKTDKNTNADTATSEDSTKEKGPL